MQIKTLLHTFAAVGIIGVAASLAHGFTTYADITKPGRDEPAVCSFKYGYRVSGSRSKGSEKYHYSEGDCYVSDDGVSCGGLAEASRHDRPVFFLSIYAPVGNGTVRESYFKGKFDSKKGSEEGTRLDREEFGSTLASLDAELDGQQQFPLKRAPVAVGGDFDVQRLKIKGKARLRRGKLSGSFKYLATGLVQGGENDGQKFKAKISLKIRNAEELEF